jgi:hypothetical protein
MPHLLDLERLALRIERLRHTSTHGWAPADELEFRNRLPDGRDTRRGLPQPELLRSRDAQVTEAQYRLWLQFTLDLEGLAHRNDPRNPNRVIRDMMRGRFPR